MHRTIYSFLGLLCTLTIISLTSCDSSKLSRNKAAKIIKEWGGYPNVEYMTIPKSTYYTSTFRQLYDQGFLRTQRKTILVTPIGQLYQPNNTSEIHHKREGFATNQLYFHEVTGITLRGQNKTTATVEYTLKRTHVTPFGKYQKYNEGETTEHSIEMVLYDDGWRILQKAPKVYKVSDFPRVPEFSGKSFDSPTANGSTSNQPELTLKAEKSPCIINNVQREGNNVYVTVDFVQLIPDTEFGEGYNIKNKNPKLRTYSITSLTKLGPEGFVNSVEDIEKSSCPLCVWFIEAENGFVLKLDADVAN